MSDHGDSIVPNESRVAAFAKSLFGYLCCQLDMHGRREEDSMEYTSEHFKEVIGKAVLRMRNNTYEFNTQVLDNCGNSLDKLSLCLNICNAYPNDDYFKKLYYITSFILEMMFHCYYTASNSEILGTGPSMWEIIFRNHFQREFANHGGWEGLAKAGHEICELLPNEILLPEYFQTVIASVGRLTSASVNVDLSEVLTAFKNMNLREVDEVAPVAMAEEIEDNQTEEMDQIEEIDVDLPEEVDDRPSLHLHVGGISVQSENPCEGTSKKSEECALPRTPRKRKLDPPKNKDSDTETSCLSPSKPKMDKK